MIKRKLYLWIIFVYAFLICSCLYANMIWAPIILDERRLSWPYIALGLAIEYLFVRKLTSFGIIKSILVDISMNLFSLLAGFFIFFSLIKFYDSLPHNVMEYYWENGSWFVPFSAIISIVLNTCIEYFSILILFRKNIGLRGFFWLSVANAISVGCALISLFIG